MQYLIPVLLFVFLNLEVWSKIATSGLSLEVAGQIAGSALTLILIEGFFLWVGRLVAKAPKRLLGVKAPLALLPSAPPQPRKSDLIVAVRTKKKA